MTGRSRVGLLMVRAVGCVAFTIASLAWDVRADPIEPDPLGLLFCNRGAGSAQPVGIQPPSPIVPGSCVKTQADDYTVVGGYYGSQCGASGASSMEQHSALGYQVATASIGFGPSGFGSLATAELSPDHGGPAAARTWGYFADELTIGGASGSGTLIVPLRVTGSSYVIATKMNGVPDPDVHAGISVQCLRSTSPIATCGGVLLDFSSLTSLPNMPTPIDQTIAMTIPFDFGSPVDFVVYACSVATMAADTQLGGSVSVDFSHTGVVERPTVLDALGHEVPGATVVSASHFDYLNAPAGSTTTMATSTTTSTTLAPCPIGGLERVQCLLASLPPAASCASDSLPAGFAKHVGKASSATTAALQAPSARKRRHRLRKLAALLVASDRIAAKAAHKKTPLVSSACAAAIHAVTMEAEALVVSAEAGG